MLTILSTFSDFDHMQISRKKLKGKRKNYRYSPPSPQFWGNKKITIIQSPPELGDLGGLDKAKRRQIDFAQTPQRRDNLSVKAKRAKHLQSDIFAGFKNCGANAMPLHFVGMLWARNYDIYKDKSP